MPRALCNAILHTQVAHDTLTFKTVFPGPSLAKRCLTEAKCFKGKAASHTRIQLGTRPGERAAQLTESPLLNETERGQRRVNLLPLEEGPFGEGEENNLYEEQRRQSAIPEKK